MSLFQKGDIVQHMILESKKVVVGVGRDRYLCVHLADLGSDGRIRHNTRVAMHRAANLQKIGHRDDIVEVNLTHLYQQESVSRHTFVKRWFREEVLINALFLLAVVCIVFALFSGIDLARHRLEDYASGKINEKKREYRNDMRREIKNKRHAQDSHAK